MKHHLGVRVYYEDTDFSGRVYHASYLRFLERGRTEWLRARGFNHRDLSASSGIVFAVRSLQVEYLAPAVMDDLLTIATGLLPRRGALIEFEQTILRGARVLIEASVRVATMRGERAIRPPRELFESAVQA